MISLDFKTFSKIYSAVGWSWYGLSIAGLLYMRRSKPGLTRPVKVYWPLALGFVMVAFFLVVGSLTLAFGGTKKEEGHGGGEGGRWTSVIMFGGAIVFMLGVVPAFYCTRCYNRRKEKHKLSHTRSKLEGEGGGLRRSMDKDQGQEQPRQLGGHTEGRLEEGLAPAMAEKSKASSNSSRRDSDASSVTLVDERRRRRRLERLRRQAQRNQGGHSLDPKSRTTEEEARQIRESDSDTDDEVNTGGKEGIPPMVTRPKYRRNNLGCSTTTLAVPSESVHSCISPTGPSS